MKTNSQMEKRFHCFGQSTGTKYLLFEKQCASTFLTKRLTIALRIKVVIEIEITERRFRERFNHNM